jgi:hypothetical protein
MTGVDSVWQLGAPLLALLIPVLIGLVLACWMR